MEIENAHELTDDIVEIELLSEDSVADIAPDDPHFAEVARQSHKMATLRGQLPSKRRAIVEKLLTGHSRAQIIEDLNTSYPTIKAAIDDPTAQALMAASLRMSRLRKGPTMEARAHMLWRIASRNEFEQPRVSISALDVLNKQDGVYKPELEQAQGGLVVNINQFAVNVEAQGEKAVEAPTGPSEALEGEFTPVTVDTHA